MGSLFRLLLSLLRLLLLRTGAGSRGRERQRVVNAAAAVAGAWRRKPWAACGSRSRSSGSAMPRIPRRSCPRAVGVDAAADGFIARAGLVQFFSISGLYACDVMEARVCQAPLCGGQYSAPMCRSPSVSLLTSLDIDRSCVGSGITSLVEVGMWASGSRSMYLACGVCRFQSISESRCSFFFFLRIL